MALNPRKDYVSQTNCDMSNSEEHFLWALMQIQMGQEMMPILENTARVMSKHLWELGYRHHPKLQHKKYQPPVRGEQTHLNGLARWVPMDAEDPEPLRLPDIAAMTVAEREWMVEELKRHGAIHEPTPDRGPVAGVADWDSTKQRTIKRATTTQERGIEQ